MPPPIQDVLRTFRAAPWRTPKEIEAYAATIPALSAQDLTRLLPLITDRSLSSDVTSHRNRCGAFTAVAEKTLDPELFAPYLRALRNADDHARLVLAGLLPKVNSVGRHGELCELLGASAPELRAAAAGVLRQVGGKVALDAVTELVRDRAYAGRAEAMDVFVPKAAQHALPLLRRVIEAGSSAERAHALRYVADARLMAKDRPGALAVALRALDDVDDGIVAAAVSAVAALTTEDEFHERIGDRIDASKLPLVRAVIAALPRYPSPRTTATLARKLREGPSSVRLASIAALESLATADVLPPLVDALTHKQLVVRNRAAEALAGLAAAGKVDLARAIVWLLRSRDVYVRRTAVELAKTVGDANGDLAPKLLRLLRDEDWWVRERVMDALAEMMGEALTRHLVEFLQDPSDVVRRFAVGALMRLRDPRALGALVRTAMGDADWWVRESAVEAMASLHDARATPYVLDVMSHQPDLSVPCIHALQTMKAVDAAPRVAELLGDDDVDVRLAALECLAELDDHRQALWVKSCASDADPRVRLAARDLLTRWNAFQSPPPSDAPANVTIGMLDRLLVAMARAQADDLILAADRVPYIKKLGTMTPLASTVLSADQVEAVVSPHLTPAQEREIAANRDVDFSYEVRGGGGLRFRANVFRQMTGLAAVFRTIKSAVPEIATLGLPPIVTTFADMKNGLVLIGGPTGSGKSTTLAALVGHINKTSSRHIVTIEDPIEVVHARNKCLINQREVGSHTASFATALRSTLREDPDVILVGEMRDFETIAFAVTASETGHLVIGTVHTASADTTVDRLINAFPAGQQPQVRSMLAETLRAVVCQHLLRRKGAPGRVCAAEVMVNNDAVANLIRKGKAFQIPSVIATSRDIGMQSMDSDLMRLLREGNISSEEAYMKAHDKKAFDTSVAAGAAGLAGAPTASPGSGVGSQRPSIPAFTPSNAPPRASSASGLAALRAPSGPASKPALSTAIQRTLPPTSHAPPSAPVVHSATTPSRPTPAGGSRTPSRPARDH